MSTRCSECLRRRAIPAIPAIPMVDDGPGHGGGHNSGMAALVSTAIAVKELMGEHNLPGITR